MAITRGRVVVLPTGAAQTATPPSLRLFPSPGRVIDAPSMEAHRQAQAILLQAQEKAQDILEKAEKEAAFCKAQATQEGYADGIAKLAAAWKRLHEKEDQQIAAQEERILLIARLLAERLLGRALRLDADAMRDLAREALRSVRYAKRVSLTVHPDDSAALRAHLHELGVETSSLQVQEDLSLSRGSLRADTDLGTIHADLGPQLDRLLAALQ